MKDKLTFLLINPWVYDFAAYDLYFKPLGLLTLAGNLKHMGCDICFIDCMNRLDEYFIKNNLVKTQKFGRGKFYYEIIQKPEILKFYPRNYKRYGLPYQEVKSRLLKLKERKIDAILISSLMNYWYPGVFDMIKLAKEIFTDTPVFLGGIYATLMPEHAHKYSGADFVIPGTDVYSVLKSIFLKLKKHVNLDFIKNISDWEEPLFELYPHLDYLIAQLNMGCPFHCSYCASKLLCDKFQVKNIDKVIQSIRNYIIKYNISNIAFYDDALLYNFDIILKNFLLCLKDFPLYYHTPNGLHLKFITSLVAEYLYCFNFKMLRLSLETSNPHRQKKTGNKTSNEDFKKAVKNLLNAGYLKKDLEVYIMFGFPDQTKDEIKDTIKFILDNGATPKIVEYSLIPGTQDYKKYFGNKFIEPLLENNSVFYLKFTDFTMDDLLELRTLAKAEIGTS